jgi:hypothetical protein
LPVHDKAQKYSWVYKGIFLDWFTSAFVPEVKQNFKILGKPPYSKRILLLDNCRAHQPKYHLILDSRNIYPCYLPPNVTCLVQPMNHGINKNLNCQYGADFTRKLINKLISGKEIQRNFWIKDILFLRLYFLRMQLSLWLLEEDREIVFTYCVYIWILR